MYGPLMIDVAGTELTEEDRLILSRQEVGGIILFARNVDTPEQVRRLCDDIHQLQPDILIGVDQEGGRVARLRNGFTPLPAMGKLGDLLDADPCRALGGRADGCTISLWWVWSDLRVDHPPYPQSTLAQ